MDRKRRMVGDDGADVFGVGTGVDHGCFGLAGNVEVRQASDGMLMKERTAGGRRMHSVFCAMVPRRPENARDRPWQRWESKEGIQRGTVVVGNRLQPMACK